MRFSQPCFRSKQTETTADDATKGVPGPTREACGKAANVVQLEALIQAEDTGKKEGVGHNGKARNALIRKDLREGLELVGERRIHTVLEFDVNRAVASRIETCEHRSVRRPKTQDEQPSAAEVPPKYSALHSGRDLRPSRQPEGVTATAQAAPLFVGPECPPKGSPPGAARS